MKPSDPDLWRREAREGVNQDRVRLLVEAARSGDYTQATNYLCKITYLMDADGPVADAPRECFCILGLAIQVAQDNGCDCVSYEDIGTFEGAAVRNYWCTADGVDPRLRDDTETELPLCVQDWYGFDSVLPPVLLPDGEVNELAELNDQGRSFVELADLIAYTYLTRIVDGDDASPGVESAA